MTAIADVYDKKKEIDQETIKEIFSQFVRNKDNLLDIQEFSTALKFIEQEITENQIKEMFREGQARSRTDGIKVNVFNFLLFKYAVGSFGIKIFEASKILSGMDRGEDEQGDISKKGIEKPKKAVTSRKSMLKAPTKLLTFTSSPNK